jgi:hypothetical protein
MIVYTVYTVLIVVLMQRFMGDYISDPENADIFVGLQAALSLVGIALFFLQTFRTNAAYDRWWEGRVIWGVLAMHLINVATEVSGVQARGQRYDPLISFPSSAELKRIAHDQTELPSLASHSWQYPLKKTSSTPVAMVPGVYRHHQDFNSRGFRSRGARRDHVTGRAQGETCISAVCGFYHQTVKVSRISRIRSIFFKTPFTMQLLKALPSPSRPVLSLSKIKQVRCP